MIAKEVTGLTNRYQYRLTLKLQGLYFEGRANENRDFSLRLDHSLMLCQFAPDNFAVDTLLQRKYVYLNGKLVENGLIRLGVNDFIQLIVSVRFYVLNK